MELEKEEVLTAKGDESAHLVSGTVHWKGTLLNGIHLCVTQRPAFTLSPLLLRKISLNNHHLNILS